MAFEAHAGLINGLIFSDGLLISTGVDGFAKVWSIPTSNTPFELVGSEKLYDHAVTGRYLLSNWLITAGKHGGEEENVCGLDNRLKIWKIRGEEIGPAEEFGLPAPKIWGIAGLVSSKSIAVSVMKKGRPMLDIWRKL